ncbi:hypothetical protein KKF84_22225, partial [Myxococcota bacterium]|nr:hypothetical protein [Myxococcota bacterium]
MLNHFAQILTLLLFFQWTIPRASGQETQKPRTPISGKSPAPGINKKGAGPSAPVKPGATAEAPGKTPLKATGSCPAAPPCPVCIPSSATHNPPHFLDVPRKRTRALLIIEKIVFLGKHRAKASFLRGILPLKTGVSIAPDDSMLSQARLKLMSLGLFIRVDFAFKKGSQR